jgi:selenide,water dikinase
MSELAQVLRYVTPLASSQVQVGLEAPDDAAVFRIDATTALVQTVDFFTPVVDDPYSWGRIAAANALSDVYAMGGRPITALNLVGWPRALDFSLLARVLEGSSATCAEAETVVVGGHSVDDPEPKFGLAITGLVHPSAVVTKTGAPPGCDLVLTKPLGTGIISSGIKAGRVDAAVEEEAVALMTTLNRAAAEAMVEVGVAAATDVTGFGFAGHLAQMLGAEVDAEIDAAAVPVLPAALQLARAGVLPEGSRRNMEALRPRVLFDGVEEARAAVLSDAQTSGGLLIAVSSERTAALVAALARRAVPCAAVVGALVPGRGRVVVRDAKGSRT